MEIIIGPMIHIITTGTMVGITAGIVGTIRAGHSIQASITTHFSAGGIPGP